MVLARELRVDDVNRKRQFDVMILKWGLKKNTKFRERRLILDKLSQEEDAVAEKGRIGTVVLSREKLKRWKKEESINQPISVPKTLQPSLSPQSYQSGSSYTISPLPTTPRFYHIPERLFSSIEVYVDESYQSHTWVCQDGITSVNIVKPGHAPDLLDKFYGYCIAAIALIKTNSLVEARKALSNACSLIREMIEAEQPSTLQMLMDVYVAFKRERIEMLDRAFDILRTYIARMAATVIRTNHPWKDILVILGSVDLDQLNDTICTAMLAMVRVHERNLGRFHRETFLILQEYLALKHGDDLGDTEREFRALIAEIKQTLGDCSQLFQVMGLLSMNLRHQNRLVEAEALSLDLFERSTKEGVEAQDVIKAHAYLAIAQYRLGKQVEAEHNMREAARLDLQRESAADPVVWAVGRLSQLEKWLREWGRHEDADNLRIQIDGMIQEPADIIEEVADLSP